MSPVHNGERRNSSREKLRSYHHHLPPPPPPPPTTDEATETAGREQIITFPANQKGI